MVYVAYAKGNYHFITGNEEEKVVGLTIGQSEKLELEHGLPVINGMQDFLVNEYIYILPTTFYGIWIALKKERVADIISDHLAGKVEHLAEAENDLKTEIDADDFRAGIKMVGNTFLFRSMSATELTDFINKCCDDEYEHGYFDGYEDGWNGDKNKFFSEEEYADMERYLDSLIPTDI